MLISGLSMPELYVLGVVEEISFKDFMSRANPYLFVQQWTTKKILQVFLELVLWYLCEMGILFSNSRTKPHHEGT